MIVVAHIPRQTMKINIGDGDRENQRTGIYILVSNKKAIFPIWLFSFKLIPAREKTKWKF